MFGIGETELVIIVVFAFLLFGPDKLPGMGRTLGRMLRQFREASDGFTEVVQTSIMDPAAEELERSEKSPKQRRREAELEAAQAREAADAGDAQADAEASESAAPAPEPPRRETFAERKARLLAERKAREEAEAEAARAAEAEAEAGGGDGTGTEAAVAADGAESAPAAPAGPSAPAAEEKASETRSATDLYAMGGRHSSRFHVAEAEDARAVDTTGEGEAPVGASPRESDAKEEGGER